MTNLTRRAALGGVAAAIGAMELGTSTAQAAAPAAGKQAASWYRHKLGDIELTVVSDGIARFKMPDTHVVNKTRAEVDAHLAALFMDSNELITPYNPTVVNNGGKLSIIDPGLGEAAFTNTKGLGGQLMTNLAAAGIDPGAIDAIIVTHMHPDHINGILRADGSLAFPNAQVLIPAAEQKFWMDDGEMARAPKGLIEAVFKNVRRVFSGEVLKRTAPYEWDKEVVPGITAIGTAGHSAGHTSHVIASGSAKLFLQGDVSHVPYLFVRNPGWHVFFDQDPVAAEATRRRVYDMLVAEKMLMQGFHYPFPALARIEKSASGYREIPILWNPTL
jgi:glyoxylase-like metal-dependent hydrolase (beta-lactamase superfamily II)